MQRPRFEPLHCLRNPRRLRWKLSTSRDTGALEGFTVRHHKHAIIGLLLVAIAAPPLAPLAAQQPLQPIPQEGGDLSADEVREAIRQGCDYLLNEQRANGKWDEMVSYDGGVTSLCTLALLNSGIETSHPKIQKALDALRALKLDKTYVVSLQTMALAAGDPRRDLPIIQANADWLSRVQIKVGERSGSWTYSEPQSIAGDNSNTQFAVLGLHEAERVGARVDPQVWRLAADYYQRVQNPDGSWGYQPMVPGSGSMTSAGIGAWVICSQRTADPTASIENGTVQCCLPPTEDDVLERAVVWMGRNFSVRRNPGGGSGGLWHLYYLYGLERVGRLSARRFLGDHDWYREGAELLVAQQDPFSHQWQGRGHAEENPHIATALALLFLSKGRRPVLVAKLRHGPGEDWNNHRADMANITELAEEQWGVGLTWQIMDPQPAQVEDLLQAPVLFLSGSKRPQLDGLERKMRDYIDRGGFLFAEACCIDGTQFDSGFRGFLDRVFPEAEYKLRRVGPEHPLWRIDRLVRPDSPYVGRLWAVEYGCRTCVVFCEVDLSCYWELHGHGLAVTDGLPETVQKRIDDALSIGLNVLAYATNREPKGKEASFVSVDAAAVNALAARGVIRVAKLIHGGGCNDAPGALVNLLKTASQGAKLQVSTTQFDLTAADPNLGAFPIAFMHGRHDFRFTPQERSNLRTYLERGGTLFCDSICASREFSAAFRREVQLALPDHKLQRIAADHPIFTPAAGGDDIRQVELREPAAQAAGQPIRARTARVAPELEGVELDGRLAVIFSPYDISCALEQHEAFQCRGYTRTDAARIGLNVLMYSLNPDATQ
jgi:hypothetical protein